MRSTTAVALDMQRPNYVTVYAVQDDQLARWVHAELTDGGKAWTPPSDAIMTIRYRKPDGTGGWYDSLEDGSSAYAINGSSVDFGFAAQCLTVAGVALVELSFWTEAAERLTAFLFRLQVEKNPLTDTEMESSDYYNVLAQQIAGLLGATVHPPQIDPTTRNWLLWDENTAAYVDSGFSSAGTPGPADQVSDTDTYWQVSSSGTVIPSGAWSSTVPALSPGEYLWSKTVVTYQSGQTVDVYAVGYQGLNGSGAVGSVCGVLPDSNGDVPLDQLMNYIRPAIRTAVHNQTYTPAWNATGDATFPYYADLEVQGITAQWFAEVVFSNDDALSGDFAPTCQTRPDAVRIACKTNTRSSLTIATIFCWR